MDKNIEKEYKILLTREQFYQLLEKYPSLHFIEQVNIYYDNENNDIRNMRGAMRIRSKQRKHVFTLKVHTSEGLHEYECPVVGNNTDSLSKDEITNLLTTFQIQGPFHPIAKLKTARAMYINDYAELCFDINQYNETIDYEIEYEYKKEHDGFTAFNEILKQINVEYKSNCKSKIARALEK